MSAESQIRVLIAEDEEHLSTILEHFLVGRGYAVTVCRNGKAALQILQETPHHVALIDIAMPEMDGLEVLRQLRADPDAPEVLIITNPNTIDTAISAIKLGAYDYIAKPFRMAEVDVLVRRAWEKRELTRANSILRARQSLPHFIEVRNPEMRAVVDSATTLAPSDDVLILHGEFGAGKTHLARYIHGKSGRTPDMYVEVTSRMGVGSLLPYFFGTEPDRNKARGRTPQNGIFQIVENGTIVIDVGILSEAEQITLTSVIRERAYTRVGGSQRHPLRARVILCSASANLTVQRLPGVHLTIPPLRQRKEDVEWLAEEILKAEEQGGKRTIAADALLSLQQYPWPGNVRELIAVLTRVAVLAPKPEISAPDMRMVLIWESMSTIGGGAALADVERLYIETVLQRTSWHQGRAADALGISTKTLYRKMREYGFVRPRKRRLARSSRME